MDVEAGIIAYDPQTRVITVDKGMDHGIPLRARCYVTIPGRREVMGEGWVSVLPDGSTCLVRYEGQADPIVGVNRIRIKVPVEQGIQIHTKAFDAAWQDGGLSAMKELLDAVPEAQRALQFYADETKKLEASREFHGCVADALR